MKALSLWQPWATLVASGYKRFETRHWTTRHRGPIAIHASKRRNLGEESELLQTLRTQFGIRDLPLARDLPRGKVVAVAELTGCHLMTSRLIEDQEPLELQVGGWVLGRFGWRLSDVRPLAAPLPWRGRQGLFDIPMCGETRK